MKRSVRAVLGLLSLAACHSQPNQTATTTKPAGAGPAAPSVAAAASAPGTFYQAYRALLPGQADSITLHLLAGRDVIDGEGVGANQPSYAATYYGPTSAPQAVAGHPGRQAADSLLLEEYPPAPASAEAPEVITWRLRRLPGGGLTGSRAGASVRLRPVHLPASVAFTQQFLADSVAALPGQRKSPYGKLSLQTLLPAGAAPAVQAALTASILRELRGDTLDAGPAPASLGAIWAGLRADFTTTYRSDIHDMLEIQPLDSLPPYSLRYTSDQSVQVLCNERNLLSLAFYSYSYEGGAHGSYGTSGASFDLRTGRRLRYADIFLPAARAQLGPLLDRAARRMLQLKASEPLDQVLSVRHLPVTHNVYLAPGGVVFIYVPYEIASFAQGQIELFVPFSELRPLLREGLPVGGAGVALR